MAASSVRCLWSKALSMPNAWQSLEGPLHSCQSFSGFVGPFLEALRSSLIASKPRSGSRERSKTAAPSPVQNKNHALPHGCLSRTSQLSAPPPAAEELLLWACGSGKPDGAGNPLQHAATGSVLLGHFASSARLWSQPLTLPSPDCPASQSSVPFIHQRWPHFLMLLSLAAAPRLARGQDVFLQSAQCSGTNTHMVQLWHSYPKLLPKPADL